MVTVRPATLADTTAIRGLFNALIPTTAVAWRDHLAPFEEIRDWMIVRQAAGDPVLVAELGGEGAVGYSCWSGFRGGEMFPGYRHTVELTIQVDGRHFGQGIGRALLTALMNEATERGVHVVVAGVDSDNVGSIEFHEAMGFVEVARMPEVGRKFDRWLDLVLLQRILP